MMKINGFDILDCELELVVTAMRKLGIKGLTYGSLVIELERDPKDDKEDLVPAQFHPPVSDEEILMNPYAGLNEGGKDAANAG